ncbi:unnamed protein product, partial [Protopolystoma xenopodis]
LIPISIPLSSNTALNRSSATPAIVASATLKGPIVAPSTIDTGFKGPCVSCHCINPSACCSNTPNGNGSGNDVDSTSSRVASFGFSIAELSRESAGDSCIKNKSSLSHPCLLQQPSSPVTGEYMSPGSTNSGPDNSLLPLSSSVSGLVSARQSGNCSSTIQSLQIPGSGGHLACATSGLSFPAGCTPAGVCGDGVDVNIPSMPAVLPRHLIAAMQQLTGLDWQTAFQLVQSNPYISEVYSTAVTAAAAASASSSSTISTPIDQVTSASLVDGLGSALSLSDRDRGRGIPISEASATLTSGDRRNHR